MRLHDDTPTRDQADNVHSRFVLLAGASSSIIFGATNTCACRDKHTFVVTNTCLSRQTPVCRDKTHLLWRQKYACRDKTFVATRTMLLKTFVATKMILVADHANDIFVA